VTDAISTPIMPSLFVILELVEKRPSMYVGFSDEERGAQLLGLEMLIAGYSLAVYQHRLNDPGWLAYASFPDYLQERFDWSMSCGPIRAIRDACGTDHEAWNRFWDLLREFRASRGEP
jgi:hypothetical protein